MADKIRWGILGTGNMARQFARDLTSVEDAALTAVASRSFDNAQKFANEFSIAGVFGSYADFAAEAPVDVVYISTPHDSHAENSIMCLKAGMAVLCEKPFTINVRKADAVIEAARKSGRFLMEAMWTRFLPVMAHLKKWLAEDRIGRLTLLQSGGGFMPPYNPNYYLFDPARGGGVLLDAGVYLVHLAVNILGMPRDIRAIGYITERGIDEQFGLLLGYDGGAMADLHVSLHMKSKPEAKIYGDRGIIHVHGPIFCPSALTLHPYEGDSETISFPVQNGYAFQAREVNRCLRAGLQQSPLMTWDETRHVMQIMDEARAQMGLRYPME